jgi:Alginate lyase
MKATIPRLYSVLILLGNLLVYVSGWKVFISDPEFRYGDEVPPVAIYRLIGNDMPPLQSRGQLRWNTQYALNNEKLFNGATKRWILNRIWNETEFEMIYGSLVKAGVHRRDIIARCFDIDEYMRQPTMEDKLFYLTSQNEGRNEGIIDGRNSGFEWSVILDGNTFITEDSWEYMQESLIEASESKKQYLKIPYHRVHSEQSTTWLNTSTTIFTALKFAPLKGESQVAFHKSAKEMFTLGDTNLENKLKGKVKAAKGYGQRNKSYMFKDGQICSADSKICACAKFVDANEEDAGKITWDQKKEYVKKCGLVLRLWSYPSDSVISTGLSEDMEKGFFCYLDEYNDLINHRSECDLVNKAISIWTDFSADKRESYHANSDTCKEAYEKSFLSNSCFRSKDREIAQNLTNQALEVIWSQPKSEQPPLCMRLRPPPNDPSRKHFLIVYNETTLETEKQLYQDKTSEVYPEISPLVKVLIKMADRGLKLGPYSVLDKKRMPIGLKDKRFYYSVRPYYWPLEDCPADVQADVKSGKIQIWKSSKGLVHRDGIRLPGTIIGAAHDDNYDRASAWNLVDNVTTLALAWHFTGDKKYSDYGAKLVNTFFIDTITGMYPSLEYAQDGDRTGLIDWKDFYYLTDAFTLLERSGSLSSYQAQSLQTWCAELARWIMNSKQGHEEATGENNHGLYADQTVMALALYAFEDDLVDIVRTRLHFRLAKPYPVGHFGFDGSQPHELSRPTSLHYITFNLAGWIHVAMSNEAARKHSELPYSMESLLWIRHEGDPDGEPVLLKAIRWYAQWLPPSAAYYERWTQPERGMHMGYPYEQDDEFAFDRMLEIIEFGVGVYGAPRLFGSKPSKAIRAALTYSRYSTKRATLSAYSSVHPDAGSKAWFAFGVYERARTLKADLADENASGEFILSNLGMTNLVMVILVATLTVGTLIYRCVAQPLQTADEIKAESRPP